MDYNYFRVFEYFKYSLEDAFFEIPEIFANVGHPQHVNLKNDIEDLKVSKVESYIVSKGFSKLIDEGEDKYSQMCKWFLIDHIQKGIAQERLEELKKENTLSLPYRSANLIDLEVDKHNLVSVRDFNVFGTSIRLNDYIYHLAPMINAANSSHWISKTISKYISTKNLNFKIRLDPFTEVHHSNYHSMGYKMDVYGIPLDWERLKSLKEDEHGQWMNDDLSNNNITDYVWKPTATEVHFTCEELPCDHEVNYRGSRYFHAIFDKRSGLIKHCDGAIRTYSEQELDYRLRYHVRNSEVRKVGVRIKIFQLDDLIDQETFVDLITNYMVWNNDLIRYFNS